MANDKSLELQIKIATEEALRAITSLQGEIKSLANEAKKFAADEGENLEKSFKEAETAAKDTSMSIGDIKKAIGSLTEVVAATKALNVIKDMGAFALKAADDFQTARNQFGVLLGDMQAGAGLFNEIKAFGDKTPFDLSTLTQATNVLISAKVPLNEINSQLAKFGDLSQGNAQRFSSYINAFSQASAKGKADMQILNTYLNQGVPILDALAKNFNATTAEIVEMSSQGKISFEEFSKALDDLTAAGGQYFGGMELASESLASMQEGLQEAVNSLAASFGEMLMPAAIAVVEKLTGITNAINENPIFKGLFAAAIAAVAVYLAALAVKATIAFAAQMKLNFAFGALNPVVLGATIAVAALAAGYTALSATAQKAAHGSESLALEQRKLREETLAATRAIQEQADALAGAGLRREGEELVRLHLTLDSLMNDVPQSMMHIVTQAQNAIETLRTPVDFFGGDWWEGFQSAEERWAAFVRGMGADLQRALTAGRADLADVWANKDAEGMIHALETIHLGPEARARIGEIRNRIAEILTQVPDAGRRPWQEWFETVTDIDRAQFGDSGARAAELFLEKLEQAFSLDRDVSAALGDNFDIVKMLRSQQADIQKTITEFLSIDAREIDSPFTFDDNSIKELASRYRELGEAIRQIEFNEYINKYMGDLREKIDAVGKSEKDLAIARLEAQGAAEAEIGAARALLNELERAEILERYRRQAEDLTACQYGLARAALAAADATQEELDRFDEYVAAIKEAGGLDPFEEARDSVADWRQSLEDNLLAGLTSLGKFSGEASAILAGLSAQFVELSAKSALSGFEEFGRALGEGKDAAESLQQALAQMAGQILQQLPMMFLQAGLQLIANGQWPMGLGFIAAAGSSAIMSGYVSGVKANAHGNVYDGYGQAARAFAAGGAFTNQIVSQPTYFRFGGSLGVMGEAGPEAVMPLKRMPGGNLGVESGSCGNTAVYVIIQNYTNEEVRTEETSDAGGNQIRKIIIGAVKEGISSGEMDRTMASRYGIRAQGV